MLKASEAHDKDVVVVCYEEMLAAGAEACKERPSRESFFFFEAFLLLFFFRRDSSFQIKEPCAGSKGCDSMASTVCGVYH